MGKKLENLEEMGVVHLKKKWNYVNIFRVPRPDTEVAEEAMIMFRPLGFGNVKEEVMSRGASDKNPMYVSVKGSTMRDGQVVMDKVFSNPKDAITNAKKKIDEVL